MLTPWDGGGDRVITPPRQITPPARKKAPPSNASPGRRRSVSGGGGPRYSPPSGSSRSGGRPTYGGGGAPAPSKPPTPAAPSIGSYLGTDEAYQQAVRGGKRSLSDFLSEMNRRRGEAGTTFNQTKQTMETDRVNQLEKLRDEFASRGLIQSGLYGQEQGRFQEQFAQQMHTLEQQQAGLLSDLLGQERNYRREQELALEVARQEALARRAQRYKLGS